MFKLISLFFIISLSLLQLGCDNGETAYAPVVEVSSFESIPKDGSHRVQPGETLYEIAWRYGLDYRYLAERNRISSPYIIQAGQIIYLKGSHEVPHPAPIASISKPKPLFKPQSEPVIEAKEGKVAWLRPTQGKIIRHYSAANKGIDISDEAGTLIRAAANGKVVYCGNGLRGYGNLIILKHNSLYLSAYAHNREVLVKEGDLVKQGQKIGEMGNTGTDKVMLHFEIRRAGKPIDPLPLIR